MQIEWKKYMWKLIIVGTDYEGISRDAESLVHTAHCFKMFRPDYIFEIYDPKGNLVKRI